jgi:hypothetical protein
MPEMLVNLMTIEAVLNPLVQITGLVSQYASTVSLFAFYNVLSTHYFQNERMMGYA